MRIEALGNRKFKVWWSSHTEQTLFLDFEPIVRTYNLQGDFCLLHWQAKPKGLRQWGLYDNSSQYYYSFKESQFIRQSLIVQPLQIDETEHKTVPTAVLLIEGKLQVNNKNIKILKSANDLTWYQKSLASQV